jgi:hypothetical protein
MAEMAGALLMGQRRRRTVVAERRLTSDVFFEDDGRTDVQRTYRPLEPGWMRRTPNPTGYE